jgi:ankyrin repeat protein
MDRNQELISAVKQLNIAKVQDLLNEQKYMDMCADVNFMENQNNAPLHLAVEL